MPKSSEKKPEININDERSVRIGKMTDLINAGMNPYPSQSIKKHRIVDARAQKEGASVSVAGRIRMKRDMGKLTFCLLEDESGSIQIALKRDVLGDEQHALFVKKVDVGDIVDVAGTRFVTKKGEESIQVESWRMLTKALRPLPDKFHGISDEEVRLRKRYLDLLFHADLRESFRRKSLFWNSMRQFLVEEGFLEVETPVLETTAGGADATPFRTHHNSLDMDVYLRISMGELWQKRLMVGGFEKTFEIGRQFRNEGMSREHLQDYTQMEFYWAYANYEEGMDLVERMYKHIIQAAFGTLRFPQISGFEDVDFSGNWERIDYVDEVKKQTGVDVRTATEDELKEALDRLKIVYEKFEGRGRLIDSLWKYCRKHIKGPVFLLHHPVDVSPLAKRHETLHNATERYQIIVAGSELGNGYSELNDPIDQAERFEEQARLREAGDSEAQMHDADFVEALEYGMPPTTGFGVSERLFSFLENKPIRECVLFPLVRPELPKKKKEVLVAHAVILEDQPEWSRLNTAAHLSASFAARKGKELIDIEDLKTKDGVVIPMNIQHAIVMKNAKNADKLRGLKESAEKEGCIVSCFTKEMRDSTFDKTVKEKQEKKNNESIAYLGVLIFGEKKKVEKLTKQFAKTA